MGKVNTQVKVKLLRKRTVPYHQIMSDMKQSTMKLDLVKWKEFAQKRWEEYYEDSVCIYTRKDGGEWKFEMGYTDEPSLNDDLAIYKKDGYETKVVKEIPPLNLEELVDTFWVDELESIVEEDGVKNKLLPLYDLKVKYTEEAAFLTMIHKYDGEVLILLKYLKGQGLVLDY